VLKATIRLSFSDKEHQMKKVYTLFFAAVALSCGPRPASNDLPSPLRPAVVTEKVKHDSDDPAIWINPADATQAWIIGTDKGGETGDGGLFVFDLKGKRIDSVRPLKRPNNVDVAYGLKLGDRTYDIAVCTERLANTIRVFSLPDLEPLDGGGIPVFETEPDSLRDPMGIALYTNPADGLIYAMVGRKSGPTNGTYIWQYLLEANENNRVKGTLKRKFGFYSGKKEIESIAVDNEMGFVYHSDEQHGVHKSYAHPDSSNVELALFGTSGFTSDVEGISIYQTGAGTGYILVSDQQANLFRVFPREGRGGPHVHPELAVVALSTVESDGSDVTHLPLPGFEKGLFVAMTDDGTFQLYDWREIAKLIPGN
jgi:3-phytase